MVREMLMRGTFRLIACAALYGSLLGCAAKVDRLTVDRVVERGMRTPDMGNVCALGESLRHVLEAMGTTKKAPHKALVIAETTAATCAEAEAWALSLESRRARANLMELGTSRTAEIRDARIRSDRSRQQASRRFFRAYTHLEAAFGPVGEKCPRISPEDEVVYLVGLVAGELALLHDKASGSALGLPLDMPLKIGRASECLPNEDWWNVPQALQAAGWAIIPGSAPAGTDPWELLEEAAVAGQGSGVRVARALSVLLSANADNRDRVEHGIKAHAESLRTTKQNEEWALLDEYARVVSLHESDLLWTAAMGYVTPRFGDLPLAEEPEEADVPDLFADDDPFGAAPSGDSPDEEPQDEELNEAPNQDGAMEGEK
jgi:hypothetical protein